MATVIVEGPDRVGKSTQIKRLMKYFVDKPIQWLHYSSTPGLSPEEQTSFFKKTFNHTFQLIQNESSHWILDRSWLGETVYGPLYRPTENPNYVWYLEGKHDIINRKDIALIVMYDSSFENLKRDDGDSYSTNLEVCKKEVEGFKMAFNSTAVRHKILIDIAGKNADQVEEEIREFIKAFRIQLLRPLDPHKDLFWKYLSPNT